MRIETNRGITKSTRITFADKVRVRATTSSESHGVAGQTGIVIGFNILSQTRVEVIGDDDYVIAVMIEGKSKEMWFAENLLEFVDHQPGTTMKLGGRRLIRDDQGEWHELPFVN